MIDLEQVIDAAIHNLHHYSLQSSCELIKTADVFIQIA